MKVYLAFVACCLCMFASSLVGKAQGWQGIQPLHSSQEEVERRLGRQSSGGINEGTVFYDLPDEAVTIDYARDGFCLNGELWRVPKGTVLEIIISPKKPIGVSEMNLDDKRYRRTDYPDRPGSMTYFDEENGVRIDVFHRHITSIRYLASRKDENLRCVGQGSFGTVRTANEYHWLDRYYRISFNAEKKRLDNFAIHLKKNPGTIGYIIVYPAEGQSSNEARLRARRAKAYMVKTRQIESKRIATMNGGHRDKLTVELYIIPIEAPAPTPVRKHDGN